MASLVIQVIFQQWDKSQQTEQHQLARTAVADRCLLQPSAIPLFDGKVIIDQHGDDRLGNRLAHQLVVDKYFLIDRFRFDLSSQRLEFKPKLDAATAPSQLTTLNQGWVQCQYQWRYRVEEGGFVYWLYESVTLNACFVDKAEPAVFMHCQPAQRFDNLI